MCLQIFSANAMQFNPKHPKHTLCVQFLSEFISEADVNSAAYIYFRVSSLSKN